MVEKSKTGPKRRRGRRAKNSKTQQKAGKNVISCFLTPISV
jgi:hypothetical protein